MLDDETKLRAIRLISLYGKVEDGNMLLESARALYGDVRNAAILAAIRLAESPKQLAKTMLSESRGVYSEPVTEWLLSQSEFDFEMFFLLVLSDDDNSRVRALKYLFSKGAGADDPASFLHKYLELDKHFYNVVVWLDRLVYAPEPLKAHFHKLIRAQ